MQTKIYNVWLATGFCIKANSSEEAENLAIETLRVALKDIPLAARAINAVIGESLPNVDSGSRASEADINVIRTGAPLKDAAALAFHLMTMEGQGGALMEQIALLYQRYLLPPPSPLNEDASHNESEACNEGNQVYTF